MDSINKFLPLCIVLFTPMLSSLAFVATQTDSSTIDFFCLTKYPTFLPRHVRLSVAVAMTSLIYQ